jgi:hypothetical protein
MGTTQLLTDYGGLQQYDSNYSTKPKKDYEYPGLYHVCAHSHSLVLALLFKVTTNQSTVGSGNIGEK